MDKKMQLYMMFLLINDHEHIKKNLRKYMQTPTNANIIYNLILTTGGNKKNRADIARFFL